MPNDTINFLRNDLGEWLLWVIIPLMALSGLKAGELIRAGWRTTARSVATRLLIGLLIATPINGLLMLWQRWPPQHFIKLRLEPERVVLGFRWPEPELAIPFSELKNVRVIKSGGRRSRSRVRLQTATETYRSFGFSRFNEDELAVMDKFRARVGPSVAVPIH